MTHRRTRRAIKRRDNRDAQRREAAFLVSRAAVKDKSIRESVNILTPGRVALFLQRRFGRFELDVINSYDVGEVLRDSVGRGTLQSKESDPFEYLAEESDPFEPG